MTISRSSLRSLILATTLAVCAFFHGGKAVAQDCDGHCPGEEGFDYTKYCGDGACNWQDLMQVIEDNNCGCAPQLQECSPSPEYIASVTGRLRFACNCTDENNYCQPDEDFPTPCELAEDYITRYGSGFTDEEKCIVYRKFRCPSDCDSTGGGPEYGIDPVPGLPPADPPFQWDTGGGFGDPNDDPPGFGGFNFATGTFTSTETDLNLPSPGFNWTIARSNLRNQKDGTTYTDATETTQGFNWMQLSEPKLVTTTGQFNNQRTVTILYHTEGYIQFLETNEDEDLFTALGDHEGVLVREEVDSSYDVYRFYDTRGKETVFFADDDTDNGDAAGRLWTVTDAAGNQAYVGHPTSAASAISGGYGNDGIEMAVDPANRRYTYNYSTSGIGSGKKIISVVAETKTGGEWYGTPTGVTEVGRVEYDYYTSDVANQGLIGDLRFVKVELPLSDATVKDTRVRYYRYQTDILGSTGTQLPHMLRMIVGEEGVRAYDWEQDSIFDHTSDLPNATDGDLKQYSEKYMEYISLTDPRIVTFFSNGDCGCGSQSDGVYTLDYEVKDPFVGEFGYDNEWKYRSVLARPDETYVTYYVDELYKPTATIITDGAPGTGTPDRWVTQYIRDDEMGWTLEERSPANITGYTHDSGGDPDGTITASTSEGLIILYEYYFGGPRDGFVYNVRWKEGTSTTSNPENLLSTTYYEIRSLDIGTTTGAEAMDVTIPRASVFSRWVYTEETETASGSTAQSGSYETKSEYDYYEDTDDTDIDYITPKIQTITYTAVSTAKNGSNSTTQSKAFFLKDGRAQFTRSPDDIISYTGYDSVTGLPDEMVRDVDTSVSGYEPPTEAGTTFDSSGDELHQITEFTYDDQGRINETTLHAHSTTQSRVTKRSYAMLEDRRITAISIPRVVSGTSTEYYGPAGYSVSNHSGRAEAGGLIELDSSLPPTTDPSTWIDDTDDDAFTAVDTGTVVRWSTALYEETGVRALKSRAYHTIPTSEAGSATEYNETTYAYDDMGRVFRAEDPTGTISRTVYDSLGRVSSREIGTDDTGDSGGDTSGTNNMVTTELLEYDNNTDDGNSHLTEVTRRVEDGTTGERVTKFIHDVRGRTIVVEAPDAPHSVSKYDNVGRVTASATYSSVATFDEDTDPTTTTSGRMSLSETYYDERGRVYESRDYEIVQSTGAIAQAGSDIYLYAKFWYDSMGRTIKRVGRQVRKAAYGRLGRTTSSYVIATTGDAGYSDADDVTGDIVLEESRIVYDEDTGAVILSATISRFHDDYGTGQTEGALDLNSDDDPTTFTSTDIKGRIQIKAAWFDDLDRTTDMVAFGTYNASTFAYPSSPPSRSATALRTSISYNDDGSILHMEDVNATKLRYEYDDLGRVTTIISNYTGATTPITDATRDHDAYVRYTYHHGLRTEIWMDIDGDGTKDTGVDQVTTHIFGVAATDSPGPSTITANNLLREVKDPDSASATDVMRYAYNARGERIWLQDQAGNTVEAVFDDLGRQTELKATDIKTALGFDDAVKRIDTTYNVRGLISAVTQYGDTSAAITIDQVKHEYDDWGMIDKIHQDWNSTVASSGGDELTVDFTHAIDIGGVGKTLRRTGIALPDGTDITYIYSLTNNRYDHNVSRVTTVKVGTTGVASYDYLGLAQLIGMELPEPELLYNRYTPTALSGEYARLDEFGRVTTDIWTRAIDTDSNGSYDVYRDFYEQAVYWTAYGNIDRAEDNVYSGWDMKFTSDDLERLEGAKRGDWNSGTSQIDSQRFIENWTLSQTGNWELHQLGLNNDSDFTDTNELDDDGTFNLANELTQRDLDTDGDGQYDDQTFSLTYDMVGNLTDDGEDYEYVYDVWGRLRKVKNQSGTLVAEYTYNGLGHRIGWHYDVDADGTVETNSVSNSDDPWYHWVYDDRWRQVATYRVLHYKSGGGWTWDNTSHEDYPKENFVYHSAGLAGFGSSSYIDSVILRERDANTDWDAASDGTLEERTYYCQNWRADVVALVTDAGQLLQQIRYDPYGVPFGISKADVNGDGTVNTADFTLFLNLWNGGTHPLADRNFDGSVNTADYIAFLNSYANDTDLGRGVLGYDETVAGGNNRKGYAGYEIDPELTNADTGTGKEWQGWYHIRFRSYISHLGRWTRRDPLGIARSGPSLYLYTRAAPSYSVDPTGLQGTTVRPSPGRTTRPSQRPAVEPLRRETRPRDRTTEPGTVYPWEFVPRQWYPFLDPSWEPDEDFRPPSYWGPDYYEIPSMGDPSGPPMRPTPIPRTPLPKIVPTPLPGLDEPWEPMQPHTPEAEGLDPPGDCIQARYDDLVRAKDDICGKAQYGRRKCIENDLCSSMQSKAFDQSRCCQARLAVMNQCFRGGDNGHRRELTGCRNIVDNCLKLIKDGKCRDIPLKPQGPGFLVPRPDGGSGGGGVF